MTAEFDSYIIESALLCDQVRREDNGKLLLIGVYSDNVTARTFPSKSTFRILLRFKPKVVGEAHLEMIVAHDGDELVRLGGMIGINNLDTSWAPLPPVRLSIPSPGKLEFRVRETERQKFRTILEIPAELAGSSETAPELPPTV